MKEIDMFRTSILLLSLILGCLVTTSSVQATSIDSDKGIIFTKIWVDKDGKLLPSGDSPLEKQVAHLHNTASAQSPQTDADLKASIATKSAIDNNPYSSKPGYYSRVNCREGICEAALIVPPTQYTNETYNDVQMGMIRHFSEIENNVPDAYIIANGDLKNTGVGVMGYFKY